MKLLKYFIALIGILHHVESKAFQASKNNVKDTFDHMHEHLYLEKISDNDGQGYEMRYVPHVDGKPIFIPLDETVPPNMLKARPKKYQNLATHPKSDMKLDNKYNGYVKPLIKQKDIQMHQTEVHASEYLKAKTDSENKQMQEDSDHPLVIDVVTKAVFDSDHLKDETVIIRPIKKKPGVKKTIKIKPSEHGKKYFNQETYKTGNYVVNTEKKTADSFLKSDPDKVSKHKMKENIPNNYVKKDGTLIEHFDQDYDSPLVIERLTEYDYPLSENHEVSKKNEGLKYSKEKLDTKISEKISEFESESNLEPHQYESKTEDLSVIDSVSEENFENQSTDFFAPDVEHSSAERDYNKNSDSLDISFLKKNKDSENLKAEMIYDNVMVVKKTDQKTKKHKVNQNPTTYKETSNEEKISDFSYDTPVVVEAVVVEDPVKLNKKLVKYSSEMKHPNSPISKFKDIPEHKQSYAEQGKSRISSSSETSENNEQSIGENFSYEDLSNANNLRADNDQFDGDNLRDENDQFDAGSGVIDERSSNGWPLLTSFHSQERNKFKKCTTPNEEPGNCMPIQMCPTPNFQLTLNDLLKKICAIDEVFIGICCPEFPAETLKVDWENFKNVSSSDEESSETKSEECGKIQEESPSWPWMAPLISMSTRKIFCGGVLIKPQYVLTAAHCTRKIPHNQIVIILGPFGKDATNQEFEIVEIKRHSQYNPRTMQHDIALLKLSRKVSRPIICLPHDEETFAGMKALMLGWRGSFTASKGEEKLLVLSSKECPKGVGDIICTEPRTEDVMCNVDSGAPLILKRNDRYEVIGLLTWNRNDCNFPALFTRVSHFKGWIENHSSF